MAAPGYVTPPPSPSGGVKIPILFGAVIALLLANLYLFVRVERLAGDLDKQRNATAADLATLREASSVTTATSRRHCPDHSVARARAMEALCPAATTVRRVRFWAYR